VLELDDDDEEEEEDGLVSFWSVSLTRDVLLGDEDGDEDEDGEEEGDDGDLLPGVETRLYMDSTDGLEELPMAELPVPILTC